MPYNGCRPGTCCRDSMPSPFNALAVQWMQNVVEHRYRPTPMGPGDKPRDDSGGCMAAVQIPGEICSSLPPFIQPLAKGGEAAFAREEGWSNVRIQAASRHPRRHDAGLKVTRCGPSVVGRNGRSEIRSRKECEQIMDEDLGSMSRQQLVEEVKRLRAGIRAHRDSSGHDLCWHHPQLWSLLPERTDPEVAVPPWPKFMRGCIAYRASLDRELKGAPIADVEFDDKKKP